MWFTADAVCASEAVSKAADALGPVASGQPEGPLEADALGPVAGGQPEGPLEADALGPVASGQPEGPLEMASGVKKLS